MQKNTQALDQCFKNFKSDNFVNYPHLRIYPQGKEQKHQIKKSHT